METKWKTGMKYLGISLLILAVPGSTFLLPIIFSKKIRKDIKSNKYLGI